MAQTGFELVETAVEWIAKFQESVPGPLGLTAGASAAELYARINGAIAHLVLDPSSPVKSTPIWIAIMALNGYSLRGPIAAVASVSYSIDPPPTEDTFISASGSSIVMRVAATGEDVFFSVRGGFTYPALAVSHAVAVSAGRFVSRILVSRPSGFPAKLDLEEPDIETDSLSLVIDGLTWTPVENFGNSGPTDRHFMHLQDRQPQASYAMFGGGLPRGAQVGAIPPEGEVTLTGYASYGAAANTADPATVTYAGGVPGVSVVVTVAPAGGDGRERLEDAWFGYQQKILGVQGFQDAESGEALILREIPRVGLVQITNLRPDGFPSAPFTWWVYILTDTGEAPDVILLQEVHDLLVANSALNQGNLGLGGQGGVFPLDLVALAVLAEIGNPTTDNVTLARLALALAYSPMAEGTYAWYNAETRTDAALTEELDRVFDSTLAGGSLTGLATTCRAMLGQLPNLGLGVQTVFSEFRFTALAAQVSGIGNVNVASPADGFSTPGGFGPITMGVCEMIEAYAVLLFGAILFCLALALKIWDFSMLAKREKRAILFIREAFKPASNTAQIATLIQNVPIAEAIAKLPKTQGPAKCQ